MYNLVLQSYIWNFVLISALVLTFDRFLWHFMSSMLMVGIPCHFHICHLLSFGTNNWFADLPARHTDFHMLCTVIEWCWTFPTVWHMFCVHCISRVACVSPFRHLVGCYTDIYFIPFLFQPWYDVQNVLCLILTIAQNVFKVIQTLVFNQGTKSVHFSFVGIWSSLCYQASHFSLSRM
jgi:hypothetical protein